MSDTPMSEGRTHTTPAKRRWHVHVDDDFIHAATADEARVEFIQALVEDGSLIYVSDAEAYEKSSFTDA